MGCNSPRGALFSNRDKANIPAPALVSYCSKRMDVSTDPEGRSAVGDGARGG